MENKKVNLMNKLSDLCECNHIYSSHVGLKMLIEGFPMPKIGSCNDCLCKEFKYSNENYNILFENYQSHLRTNVPVLIMPDYIDELNEMRSKLKASFMRLTDLQLFTLLANNEQNEFESSIKEELKRRSRFV